jgi:MOSC N-terminal beta barrel domain
MGGSSSKTDSAEDQSFISDVRTRYQHVLPDAEEPVKIEKLYIYPIRGIAGIRVPEIRVSKNAVEYDREWDIFEKGEDGRYHS